MSLMFLSKWKTLMISGGLGFIPPWLCFWSLNQVWGLRMTGREAEQSGLPNALMQLAPSDCDFSPCTCPKGSWPRSRRRHRVDPRGRWGLWPRRTNPPPSSAPAATRKASPRALRTLTDSVSLANSGEGDIRGPAWPWYLCCGCLTVVRCYRTWGWHPSQG